MNLIFFDTETTGNLPTDRLCQLGIKARGVDVPILNELFKPPTPISFESMAVHHITEKHVSEKPLFKDSPRYAEIKELFEDKDTIAIAHNIAFDATMLASEGITIANPLCTLKIARELDTESIFSNYRLQYLRYRLGIEIDGVNAHDAWGDVVVLEAFFERLLSKMVTLYGDETSAIKEMLTISSKPSLIRVLAFGKHAGKKFSDIVKEDRGYLEWLLKQKTQEVTPGDEDLLYSLKYYLSQ